MKKKLCIIALLLPFYCSAQLTDDFSDGRFFNANGGNRPVNWTGHAEKFKVNSELQLQLDAPKDASPALLTSNSQLSTNMVWEAWLGMEFNPTSSNYTKLFLCSDKEDLTGELNGLFIRIGHTNKNLCLIAKNGKTEKILIAGQSKRLDKTNVSLHLKATINKKGECFLYSKLDGESNFVQEGSCSLEIDYSSHYMGIVCYYTATRNQAFYFDDFSIRQLKDDEQGESEVEIPETNDIVINEILPDPFIGGEEYIELYNRSKKTFDLKFLSIVTRKANGALNTSYPLAGKITLFHANKYLLITKDKASLYSLYQCKDTVACIELSTTPVLVNTSGDLIVMNNRNQEIIDELKYDDKMHTSGIINKKGVALERSNPERPTSDRNNWHSASSDAGYGTPGYINSQYLPEIPTGTDATVSVYTPDGIHSDSYKINYRFPSPGNRCKAFLYDAMGRLNNIIANNELLGTEGSLYWNGKGNSGENLKAGIYILYMEVYNTQGIVKKFKLPVVISK